MTGYAEEQALLLASCPNRPPRFVRRQRKERGGTSRLMLSKTKETIMIKDLSQDKAREMLRKGRIARLACVSEGEPYVVPVSYVFDGESVLVHSLPGRKITAMRAHPRVCLQIDEIEDELNWTSVLAFGKYEEITNAQERAHVMGSLLKNFPQLTPVESVIANDAGTPDPVVFRIRIGKITGLCEES
jgi:nitroimidazol reductase NimA-like FMN-containing flavoprotein (pyridoxamine 5'-phosphate oxidase superfamily)